MIVVLLGREVFRVEDTLLENLALKKDLELSIKRISELENELDRYKLGYRDCRRSITAVKKILFAYADD
jgi:hypothetical protein